jgi:tetratricopeptide (TPR) repeat protein
MWGEWRLTLRKAEHALKLGRLDDAVAYVTRPEVASYRQTRDLAARVAESLADRAEEHIRQNDTHRAWRDIDEAEKLQCVPDRLARLRQQIVERGIGEAKSCLKGGQLDAAVAVLNRLKQRGNNGAEIGRLQEVAVSWRTGAEHARIGRFGAAIEQLERARAAFSDCEPLEQALQQAWAARDRLPPLEAELHRALAKEDRSTALAIADEILAIAPDHVQARAARRQAWRAVGAPVSVAGVRVNGNGLRDVCTVIRPPDARLISEDDDETGHEQSGRPDGERFLLWIDGVGGYLVCSGDRVSLGQPAGWHVDVPIMADLSRLHAWIERDVEGYLLRAVRPALVNGNTVREKAVLGNDSEILLGHGVRLHFRRPSPLSSTARLDLASPHRLSLPAEAVILMAETFIIGPSPVAHIVTPGWTRELVMYRQGSELWCRTSDEFEVDGQTVSGRARIGLSARIRGEGFSLALEPVAS